MDAQAIINVLFAAAGALAGVVISRLWASVDHLVEADTKLADKVQAIELLVAGQYVKKPELSELGLRIFERLDRIEAKLDRKVDK